MGPYQRNPPGRLPPPSRGKFTALAIVALVVVLAVGIPFITRSARVTEPRELSGRLWVATAGGLPRVYYVTEEEHSQYGRYRTRRSGVFHLFARDPRTGEQVAGGELAKIPNARSDQGPEIIGVAGGMLWVWNGGLEGRDLSSLQPVWTAEKLKQVNPEAGQFLPAEKKFYKAHPSLDALVYKGLDTRYFRVDPAGGKLEVVPDEALGQFAWSKKADDGFTWPWPESGSIRPLSVADLMWDSLPTDEGDWYAMVSAEEGRNFSHWPKRGKAPYGDVARSLHRTTYKPDHKGEPGVDVKAFEPVGDRRFVLGGFLRRPGGAFYNEKAWRCADGKSVLVLSKTVLGESAPWQLTRLGLDGAEDWTRSTGLAELQHFADGQGAVVFAGYADFAQPTRNRPNLLVFIDEATGRALTLNVKSGELRPGQ